MSCFEAIPIVFTTSPPNVDYTKMSRIVAETMRMPRILSGIRRL